MKQKNSKKVIITGASRGIGRALALEFGSRGHELAIMARNGQSLAELCGLINENGGKAVFITTDVSNADKHKEDLIKAASMLGSVDIAVLNAGVSGFNWAYDFDLGKLKEKVDTNVYSVAAGIEALLPLMLEQKHGYIAGVSSLADARGFPGSSFYCASKTALTYILESARVELKPKGITIATIKPGFVRTDMTAKNKFYMPFLMEPGKAAKIIYRGIMKGKERIYFPRIMAFASYFGRIAPSFLYEWAAKSRLKMYEGQKQIL